VTCFGYERVRALDSGDGSPRWVTDVSAKGGLAAVPGLVVAADSALVAQDGRKRWTYPIEKGGVPQIGGGLVFVGDWTAGVLHAVRAADGTAVWRQRTSVLGPAMRYAGGVLYVTAGASVSALDAATGALRWSRQLPPSSQWMNTLGLSGGTVYVGAGNRTVYALDTADGRITWTCPVASAQRSAPVGMGGLAFIGSREGYVEALAPPGGGCRACA